MTAMRRWVNVMAAASLLAANLQAQSTARVSVDSTGGEADDHSGKPSISADGRFVAFESWASNLVAGDAAGRRDIFVHDRAGGTTTRVSVGIGGAEANNSSGSPVLSADGRYVVFWSDASNLVVGDTNGDADVFLHDRQSGATERVSVSSSGMQGNNFSFAGAISADGRYVAFYSFASNLVTGDTNAQFDVFVHDRQTGTTERVSVDSSGAQGNGGSAGAVLSADGRIVAFTSGATNLVAGDTNGKIDLFVHDRQSGATTRASVDSSGGQSDGDTYTPSISADGRFIAFQSVATNLVPGDANASNDAFVHDRQSGATACASVAPSGVPGNGHSTQPAISVDGRFVAFTSFATNLVAGDTNGWTDQFLRDRAIGATFLVSLDASGAPGNGDTEGPAVSADGRFLAFQSWASNFVSGDTNEVNDIFVRDRGDAAAIASFCGGDGSSAACPCGNNGSPGRGCQNSAGTAGAVLDAAGHASLASDTLVLTVSSELSSALTIFLQGSQPIPPTNFGDGLRCAGGTLKRLYTRTAIGGTATAPGSDPRISVRSAAIGDPISLGHSRYYQTYYRDANPSFCTAPQGGTFNASQAVAVAWGS
jgi:Tol biopolymer transport system component